MPADFFRTMEDASGIDLDWFWRGWFYSNEHVDLAITDVRQLNINTKNPVVEKKIRRAERDGIPESNSEALNKDLVKRADRYPELKDFYNSYDSLDVTPEERRSYESFMKSLTEEERELIGMKRNFYLITIENIGGLVMPVIIDAEFEDGTKQHVRIPAEIWRKDNLKVTKLLMTQKPIKSLVLDPRLETADVELENNYFPRRIMKSRFDVYKSSRWGSGGNPMKTDLNRKKAGKKPRSLVRFLKKRKRLGLENLVKENQMKRSLL